MKPGEASDRPGKPVLRSRAVPAGAAVAIAIFAAAFWAAPRSCEGGLELYLGFGAVALIVLFALPLVLESTSSLAARIGWAFGFVAAGTGVWVAGFAAAGVRLMCRLF
jgi:hypothetical protein